MKTIKAHNDSIAGMIQDIYVNEKKYFHKTLNTKEDILAAIKALPLRDVQVIQKEIDVIISDKMEWFE